MKFTIVLLAVLAVIVSCSATSEIDEIVKGNNQFTADLYIRLVKGRQDKNFVFSPLTIATDLGLARLGARGKTADEITKALGFPKDNDDLLEALGQMSNKVKSGKFKVSQALGLYTSKNVTVKDSFKNMLLKCPDAKLESVNFEDTTKALDNINKWVQYQTKHKIKDLLTEDEISKDTQLLLVNAGYFSATWKHPFTKMPTKKRFRISRTRSKFVYMMTVTNYFKYYVLDNIDATAIELPYGDNDSSMVIVRPNKDWGDHTAINRNLAKLIKITNGECKNKCSIQYTTVEMPLFTVWARYPMIRDLNQLGINTAFTEEADFGDMAESGIKLYNVVHKAFINVTTEGTVAAGAPGAQFQFRILPPMNELALEPARFDVYHGFVYFIKINNIVVMAGKTSHDDGIHI